MSFKFFPCFSAFFFVVLTAFGLFAAEPLNVLLITADDMNYDSLGVTGCKISNITPNLDALAAEGMLFKRAYVTASVCQPSRQVLMTGRYPHCNGGTGFNPIGADVPTLQESLKEAGYFMGIMAKVEHLAPIEKFHWDVVVPAKELRAGRDPELFYRHCKEFFSKAGAAKKPFFLMANSQDPHRPFPGSEDLERAKNRNNFPGVDRTISPDEVEVPGFLPDLPDIHKEIAQYYTAVYRCDRTVGRILSALEESGLSDSTIVMFLSDNGMAFPFAKTNVYRMSHQTPWIVRWPKTVEPGRIDQTHFISGIDFMPTILDALGLPRPDGMNGKSFVPLLKGETQSERDHVYTTFYQTSAKKDYPMRAIRTERYAYLFNPWSDGSMAFKNESQNGLTFRAMNRAARGNDDVSKRVELFLKRVPEEFFDYTNDPDALKNLIGDHTLENEIRRHRQLMFEIMKKTNDPLAPVLEKRL